jgi:mannose-6-phosphate isomerase-like protein (cupin superfamily)
VDVRRVVVSTGENGVPFVASDGPSIRSHDFLAIPGMGESVLWTSRIDDEIINTPDQAVRSKRRLPDVGGTTFLIVTFPPSSVFASESFDAASAASEQSLVSPDLFNYFEPDSAGMHATPTVDYIVVLDGEIVLDLGVGEPVRLSRGDTVVQNGARHSWRNEGTQAATLAVVMVGSK